MTISVCVPTLRRYDLLKELIVSLQQSDVKPDHIHIIDNGGGFILDNEVNFIDEYGIQHHYVKFGRNLGCAASWNWFIQNTLDIRIISNDDIKFTPQALGNLVATFDENAVTSPDSIIGSNSFSCFMLPNKVIERVGLFDEEISPNYCWLEDNDYVRRMLLAGIPQASAPNCLVEHGLSSTLKVYSPGEMREHHEKFRWAQLKYQSKWGGLPTHERYDEPYDGVIRESEE